MTKINLLLDQGDGKAYDALLEENRQDNAPQIGETVDIATKHNATKDGNTAVILSFGVMVDGQPKRVQAVVTERLFLMAASAIATAKHHRETANN